MWNQKEIENRAQHLADQILKRFPIEMPEVTITFSDPRYQLYTAADSGNATYKHVNYYELLGERVNVDNFAGMVRSVARKLYQMDPTIIDRMARNNEKIQSWVNPAFSYESNLVRNPVKLVEDADLYISTGYSAYDCISFIRALLRNYNLNLAEDFAYSARSLREESGT